MYLRSVTVKDRNGVSHEYLRLVESFWENGRSKQRVVTSLGRKDLLAPHLDSLIHFIRGQQPLTDGNTDPDSVRAEMAAAYGPALIARHLWEELGLDIILDRCEGKKSHGKPSLSDRVLALVTNRLCEPSSEHSLADWLDTDYVCDARGNRFRPKWKQQGRVRVDLSWLQQWYRTLDELVAHKQIIEEELFSRLKTLFSLKAEMVFYDITSTYFEGTGPENAQYGYSRDGKPQNRQVMMGLVMIDGWPIAHHIFAGNIKDSSTVIDVIKDLEKRFGLKRVVFVGDRGMISSDNLTEIKERNQGYLLGLKRRRNEDIYRMIERTTEAWIECPPPVSSIYKEGRPKTLVQEVISDDPAVRVFVAHSEERADYERAMRERSMEKTRQALEKLRVRVKAGRLKRAEKIGEAVGKILKSNHGHRYYDWELVEGEFRYFEHPVHFQREKALEGKYLIQTEEKDLSPVEAVQAYKELSEVENGFRKLKDVIEMRPVYHRRKERVEAHIFIATLAFLLDRALEKRLKTTKASISATTAMKALRTIHVVEIAIGEETKMGVTKGNETARQILSCFGITKPDSILPKND